MGDVLYDGTGRQGYLPEGTRYEDIVRVFGGPQLGKSLDGKIKAEWVGRSLYDLCLQVIGWAGVELRVAYWRKGEAGRGAGEYLFQGKTIRYWYYV